MLPSLLLAAGRDGLDREGVDRAVVEPVLHGGIDELVLLQQGHAAELRRLDLCLEVVAGARVEVADGGLRAREVRFDARLQFIRMRHGRKVAGDLAWIPTLKA